MRLEGCGTSTPEELDGDVTRSATTEQTTAPAVHEARRLEAASSKQSSENRAHDASVVPVTARLHVGLGELRSWLVHRGRGGVVKPVGQCST